MCEVWKRSRLQECGANVEINVVVVVFDAVNRSDQVWLSGEGWRHALTRRVGFRWEGDRGPEGWKVGGELGRVW